MSPRKPGAPTPAEVQALHRGAYNARWRMRWHSRRGESEKAEEMGKILRKIRDFADRHGIPPFTADDYAAKHAELGGSLWP